LILLLLRLLTIGDLKNSMALAIVEVERKASME
jgi:hypothetical protein